MRNGWYACNNKTQNPCVSVLFAKTKKETHCKHIRVEPVVEFFETISLSIYLIS